MHVRALLRVYVIGENEMVLRNIVRIREKKYGNISFEKSQHEF